MKDFMGMMSNMGIMGKIQDMQKRMAEIQEEIANKTVEGTSGAGMVTVTLAGSGEMKDIKIDPTLVNPEEMEMLEDLIQAAFNNARQKATEFSEEKKKELTAGLPIPPGMNLF